MAITKPALYTPAAAPGYTLSDADHDEGLHETDRTVIRALVDVVGETDADVSGADDGDVLYAASGLAAWGPRGMVCIAEQVLSSALSSVSFQNIPQNYRHLWLMFVSRQSTGSGTFAGVTLRFNNDSGSNYDAQTMQAGTTTVSSSETFGATSLVGGQHPTDAAAAGLAGQGVVLIRDYARSAWMKTITTNYGVKYGTSSGNMRTGQVSGFWRDTSAITRIDLFPGADDFMIGSVFTLYGLPALPA